MLSYFHILLLLKGAIMRQKNICYFRQNESTNETVHILDCGYHETTDSPPRRPSSTTMFYIVL